MLFVTELLAVNFPAVFVAGVVHMVIGLIWFQPKLFGNAWAKLTGRDLKPAARWIAAGVIGHQLVALALAVIVNLAKATTVLEGTAAGVLAWAGFVVTMQVGELIWERIPFRLFLIRIGNHLLGFSTAGAILAVWHRQSLWSRLILLSRRSA